MLMQAITPISKRSTFDSRHLTGGTSALFACAPELIGTHFSYGRDEEIYGEGEETEFVYKVVTGAVRTCKITQDGRRQIAGFYLSGDLFGLDFGAQHTQNAEATADSKIMLFNRRQVEGLAGQNLDAARELWQLTAGHLRHAEDHMLLLGRKTATEKLAAFLLEMDVRLGGTGKFELLMPRRDIADYLGLTLETVSRGFSQFQESNLIALTDARHVTLVDRRKLAKLSG
jgi:CRP/FNR family nitrogen fixation transcriptional regulator